MTEHERRDGAARPRLELPRFQFGATASAPGSAGPLGGVPVRSATPHLRAPGPSMQMAHAPQPATPRPPFGTSAGAFAAPSAPQPTYVQQHAPSGYTMAPQQHYVHGAAAAAAAAPAPMPMAAPMPAPIAQHTVVPAHALAPTPAPARAAAVNWERLEQPEEERTWLQKITPVHMGFLLAGVVVLMIIGSKPGAVKATTGGGALPGIDGGGATIMPVQPRPTITTPTAVTTPAPKTIRIGTGELSVTAQHGGIPTAAATEAMSATGGGGTTRAIKLRGMPSSAASERIGGKVDGGGGASDGVTLPRSSSERDAASGEAHYSGGGGTSDELPATPVMTPGSSAAAAERQAAATMHPSAIMTSEMNNSAM